MTTENKGQWDAFIRIVHWLTLALIVAAWWAVEAREDFPKGSDERTMWMMRHVTLGLSIWFLTLFRLGWRIFAKTPVVVMPGWQRWIARLVQAGLYLVLLGMPLSMILARQFAMREASFGGLFSLPQLVTEKNVELAEWFGDLHEDVFWPALLILAGVHAIGALHHQFIMKDNLLGRMFWSKR